MLSENIRSLRKSRGLSQEELAIKLNVVRQTVSKWERGISVPDSEMLIALSEALDTSVSILLGETVVEARADDLKVISERLEIINLQLANQKAERQKAVISFLVLLAVGVVVIFAILWNLNSPYLAWDYSDPETAVLGVAFHAFEWIFIRIGPVILIGVVVGFLLMYRKG